MEPRLEWRSAMKSKAKDPAINPAASLGLEGTKEESGSGNPWQFAAKPYSEVFKLPLILFVS